MSLAITNNDRYGFMEGLAHIQIGRAILFWPSLMQNIQIVIFSRQASLTRQAFRITALQGARYKTGKNAYAKK